jgi:hypothetical protein
MTRGTVTCRLPPGQERWRPDPFPGSVAAERAGCLCPADQPWPGGLCFAVDCPVHPLEKVPAK